MRAIFDIVKKNYLVDASMPFEEWLSHYTGAISCCDWWRLLTGLLYVSTALRLLRRHYANFFDTVLMTTETIN
jgi:hypothetical protein